MTDPLIYDPANFAELARFFQSLAGDLAQTDPLTPLASTAPAASAATATADADGILLTVSQPRSTA